MKLAQDIARGIIVPAITAAAFYGLDTLTRDVEPFVAYAYAYTGGVAAFAGADSWFPRILRAINEWVDNEVPRPVCGAVITGARFPHHPIIMLTLHDAVTHGNMTINRARVLREDFTHVCPRCGALSKASK